MLTLDLVQTVLVKVNSIKSNKKVSYFWWFNFSVLSTCTTELRMLKGKLSILSLNSSADYLVEACTELKLNIKITFTVVGKRHRIR